LVAQESRPQLQVGLILEVQRKSRMTASSAPSLGELVLGDVKSVDIIKIQAVKNLDRAIDYVESVAQDLKHTLVAVRLTQVLLIERASKKKKTAHCKRSRSLFRCFAFCV
jgi:hypothetical protein